MSPLEDRRSGERPAEGGSRGGILRLSFPIVVSFGLRSIYGIVDTAFAATLEGQEDASVAAIGLTIPLEFLMTACWVGTSNGLTAQLSTAIGQGRGDRVEALKRAATRIVLVLVGIFLLVSGAVYLGAERVGLDPDLARQLRTYATVLMAGSALTAFWSIVPDSLVKAHHDTKSTMWAGIISGATNVVLNAIFVFVFGMGIFGIALSTVLSRLFSLLYALRRAAYHERRRRASHTAVEGDECDRPTRAILFIAIPSSITFLLLALESTVLNWMVKEVPDSTAALAAWSIFDRAAKFCSMPLIAVSVAMLPLVARLHGQGDIAGIRRQVRTASLFALGYLALIVTPLAFLFGDTVAGFFAAAESTRALATAGMVWVPVATLALAPFFPLRAAFEGMQMPGPGLVVSVVRSLVLVVPLTWVGIEVAPSLGYPALHGAFAGSSVGAIAATIWLGHWLRSVLRRADPAHRDAR